MSRLLIQNYYTDVEKIIQYGGSRKETTIREAFKNLLNGYCKSQHFILIPELEYRTQSGTTVYPDGTIKDALRLPWGYWESKDIFDDLDKEIQAKLAKGYPSNNILFEDSQTAILIQGGQEVQRVSIREADKLEALLTRFISYERVEVRDFRQAIERFKADLPTIVETLRNMLTTQAKTNKSFRIVFNGLLTQCQESINPKINAFDIREMIIQHILTEDIFLTVFNEAKFHQENVVARHLKTVVSTFFTGKLRRDTLKSIESYYAVIRREAANISNHHEKQKFLNVIYENFYKTYNPKAADRLGIVYTPNEIVRFMIESTDYLLDKHFNRLLADDNVEILDPATGTGTFITELIEYLPKNRLRAKYLNEIHGNEVAILPYYIANLNIEYTYQQKMGEYEAFSHICFVDTLDNLGFEHNYQNQQKTSSLGLGEENAARIEQQRKISVIIGNPPYNANQQNENDNNKNRNYPEIDEAIKRTYIANSTARKTKLYDMYARFFRWASNRLADNGILTFVTNSSFLEARTFDGFRKVVAEEFNTIYVIDLKGNARTSGERRRKEGGNVFSDAIRVGVAVYFFVKDENAQGCKIYYNAIRDYAKADEKKQYLRENKLKNLDFERIMPDKNHNWLNIADNDFEELLLLVDKKTKKTINQNDENAVFKLNAFGIVTARDEWVYDFNKLNLEKKMRYFIDRYNELLLDKNFSYPDVIKWSSTLKKKFNYNKKIEFSTDKIGFGFYRPIVKKFFYAEKSLNDRLTKSHYLFFGNNLQIKNKVICVTAYKQVAFVVQITSNLFNYAFGSRETQGIPLYYYDSDGSRVDNITDWGLNQFCSHYLDESITKEDIFHYTYAVLHHPAYREKYAFNLNREFPRLPFYDEFHQWVAWGKQLMDLHLNYETVKKYPLKRVDKPLAANKPNKPKLKADKDAGNILLDAITTLQRVPVEAWHYQLGNRSALEWILDQYKEKKLRDKTIAEKFNTYRFADYKEYVIELLQRVCSVSVETRRIIGKMPKKSEEIERIEY
ncbi:MAG: DNA methyltransferase [Candidatus Parabeggiatoa sp. nov. 2]|nr:MAG: DNA methyltransferase [Beggiatoa sp. 4572_84]RKZ56025.1 MAG: DNA methyltransferase [Gammaproteobacteria bacterium]